MTFFTQCQYVQLLENGSEQERGKDHSPVVKLYTPDAGFIWLLTEINPEKPDMAFGLCDHGQALPEMGYVSLLELATMRGQSGLRIEREISFTGQFPISVYAMDARHKREITLAKPPSSLPRSTNLATTSLSS